MSAPEAPYLRRYLTMLGTVRRECSPDLPRYPESVLLARGVAYAPTPEPKAVKWGRKQECYKNAAQLAIYAHRFKATGPFTYVEGYALGIIACPHAWVVDAQGRVIDNTWRDLGTEYLGLPIRAPALMLTLARRGVYGLLDDSDLYTAKLDPFPKLLAQPGRQGGQGGRSQPRPRTKETR